MYSPKSSVPMDQLSPHFSTRHTKTIMIALMNEQRGMMAVSDDMQSLPVQCNTFEPAIPYHFVHVQAPPFPISKDIYAAPFPTSTPLFSPRAPQIELF